MSDALFVYITAPDDATARRLGRLAVEEGLAACANILPAMTSIYRWQGQIEEANELILILKTSADMYEKLEEKMLEAHPYECPCIVALPVVKGSASYLEWINNSLKKVP